MQNILVKALSHLVVADTTEQLADLYLLNYHGDLYAESEDGSDEESFHRERKIELRNIYEEKYQLNSPCTIALLPRSKILPTPIGRALAPPPHEP